MTRELVKFYELLAKASENAAVAQVLGPVYAADACKILEGTPPVAGETVHELKTWIGPFQDLITGRKWFELRAKERLYKPGDVLVLREYNNHRYIYTGRVIYRRVTYIMKDVPEFGLPLNMMILQLSL